MRNFNNSYKLLAGVLALVLVAGMTSPAFAEITSGEEVDEENNVQLEISPLLENGDCKDVDFFLTGVGSGTLGQTPFVNSDFIITVWANTCDVFGGPIIFNVPDMISEITVDGIGTATVTQEMGIFTNDENDAVGFQRFNGGIPGSDFIDLFDIPNDGYNLTTNFGPVFDITPLLQNGGGLNTDLGIFSLDSVSDASFTAELKDNIPIGGTSFPVSTTTLLVAGAQANMGLLSLALVGMVAAGAAITYKLKSKKTEQ